MKLKLHFVLFFFLYSMIVTNDTNAQVTFTFSTLSGNNFTNPRTTTEVDGSDTYVLIITANENTPGFDANSVFPNQGSDDLTFTLTKNGQQQLFDLISITIDDFDVDGDNVVMINNTGQTIAQHNVGGDITLTGGSLNNNIGLSSFNIDQIGNDAGFTNITIGNSVVLPVELTSFTATLKDKMVRLGWTTATEKNNQGFEVQRSTDSDNFETLTFVEGVGTTIEEQVYYHDDRELSQNQTYYYRLKQVDYDGQFEYSKVVSVTLESDVMTVGNFYPNPTNGITNLEYNSNANRKVTISVTNISGQEVLQETRNVTEGLNNLNFNFGKLERGTYFVRLQAGEDIQYQKLLIN